MSVCPFFLIFIQCVLAKTLYEPLPKVTIFGLTNSLNMVFDSSKRCFNITDCYPHMCDILNYTTGPASFVGMLVDGPPDNCDFMFEDHPVDMIVFGIGNPRKIYPDTAVTCTSLRRCFTLACEFVRQTGMFVGFAGACM